MGLSPGVEEGRGGNAHIPCHLLAPQQTPLGHPDACLPRAALLSTVKGNWSHSFPRGWGEVQLEGEGGGSWSLPPPPPPALTGCSWACHLLLLPCCPRGSRVRLPLSLLSLRHGADGGRHGASALGLPDHWGQGLPHAHHGDQGKGWAREARRGPHPHGASALLPRAPRTPSFLFVLEPEVCFGGAGPGRTRTLLPWGCGSQVRSRLSGSERELGRGACWLPTPSLLVVPSGGDENWSPPDPGSFTLTQVGPGSIHTGGWPAGRQSPTCHGLHWPGSVWEHSSEILS